MLHHSNDSLQKVLICDSIIKKVDLFFFQEYPRKISEFKPRHSLKNRFQSRNIQV